jgi:uncharacterized protein (DUF302 family)
MRVEGLRMVPSTYSVRDTIDRLVAGVTARGMVVFARVDHAAGAAAAGMELRPTELLIFGAAPGGTPLMQAAQTTGIDLPLKALAWQDAAGQVWLGVNEPRWIAARHDLGAAAEPAVQALQHTLTALIQDQPADRR